MATKKRSAAKKAAARRGKHVIGNLDQAIASGEKFAAAALAVRAKQRNRRRRRERDTPVRQRAPRDSPAVPERTRALLGPSRSAGVLLAEGDSWFDYPFHDILQLLEEDYSYDVESVAHRGDCVEDMAYSGGQFAEFTRRLEKLLRAGTIPKAILLSGGGNDIAGDDFAVLLNHAASSLPSINEDIVRGVIDVRLPNAYAGLLSGLAAITRSYLDRPIPVVTHGYDYPIPDGRGVLGGWSFLPGPWLQPGFRKKGYGDLAVNTAVIATLIDRFNNMLAAVCKHSDFAHVHYVDLRKTVTDGSPYKKRWANELHPTPDGFESVTAKFAGVIGSL